MNVNVIEEIKVMCNVKHTLGEYKLIWKVKNRFIFILFIYHRWFMKCYVFPLSIYMNTKGYDTNHYNLFKFKS